MEKKKDEKETKAFKIGKDIDLLGIESDRQSDSEIKECGDDLFLKNLDFYSQNRFHLMITFWDYYFNRVCEWAETFSHEHNYYHKNRIKYFEALDIVSENQFTIGSVKYSDHIYNLFESDFKAYLRIELHKRKNRLGLTKHGTESDYLLAQFLPVIYAECNGFYVTISDFCFFNCTEPCYVFLVPSQTGLFPICESLTPLSYRSRCIDLSNIDSYYFNGRFKKNFFLILKAKENIFPIYVSCVFFQQVILVENYFLYCNSFLSYILIKKVLFLIQEFLLFFKETQSLFVPFLHWFVSCHCSVH